MTGSLGRRWPTFLRLFGAGAAGSIVLALGDGPLRTKELTARVPGYAPRTVYRYVSKLAELGAIEREEEPGVPSKVVHSLADPCGVELHELVGAFARASLDILPDGEVVSHSWGSLTLLADLWESGMFQELNAGPCTATELAGVSHELSFHQVSRRTSLFVIGGLIRETEDGGRRRRYELTEQARRETAMIAGLGGWRERHLAPAGEPGLTAVETAELLRAALPLAQDRRRQRLGEVVQSQDQQKRRPHLQMPRWQAAGQSHRRLLGRHQSLRRNHPGLHRDLRNASEDPSSRQAGLRRAASGPPFFLPAHRSLKPVALWVRE